MNTQPIEKGTEVRVRTTNGGESYGTLERDYVPTYAVWFKPNVGAAYVITAGRLASIEPAKESERPGYHCDCWDLGKPCCHCGHDGENGDCIPTCQQKPKPCEHTESD